MDKRTALGKTFTSLVLEVFRVNGLLLEAGDRMTQPVALTSSRWQVLGVIDHGPASVAQIARVMGLTRQSVQQSADALEKDGFVEYRDNPQHRRAKLVAMTKKGRDALHDVEDRQAQWANRMGEAFELQRLRKAVRVLRHARQTLEQDEWDALSPPSDAAT